MWHRTHHEMNKKSELSTTPIHVGNCTFHAKHKINLMQLIPPTPSYQAANPKHGGRCEWRYQELRLAIEKCAAVAACTGVTRDNGLQCSGGLSSYELRTGSGQPAKHAASFMCKERMRELRQLRRLNEPEFENGVVFILMGGCGTPSNDCGKVNEAREAIQSVRAVLSRPPSRGSPIGIAILTDGGFEPDWLMKHLQPNIVQPLTFTEVGLDDDLRAKKLLAYTQTPFKHTVFMDVDTYVLRPFDELFEALTKFDLAAAFECCRLSWADTARPYDARGFMKGWEMQTGVMAYRRNGRVAQFWRTAYEEYVRDKSYWRARSSGEQGAATYALSKTDVRFMPLPPAFNARPYTLYQWLEPFGISIYHGKELWKHEGLDGQRVSVPQAIRQRMLRDWRKAETKIGDILRDHN
mmetsp:Transcript_29041/g.60951  ORF Transcript_29041/g.60951 Transcript_29041/m.60951 type:complete len:409 (+) Transcript_29041:276-1502(+)